MIGAGMVGTVAGIMVVKRYPLRLTDMSPAKITVIFGMFWSISYMIETALMFFACVMADMTGNIAYAATFAVICSSIFFLPQTGKKPELVHVTTKNA